ncbi:MAG TPA: glutamate carboxypeptidase [Vicinamibacterales bacterium]|nr:glutamate carboxypeptidase [Vicinamibacterales bacterium]
MRTRLLVLATLVFVPALASAQVDEALRARVRQQKQPLLDTLRDLVSIESGSGDAEGIARIGALIADRLRALGGEVEMVPPAANMPRFTNTPPKVGDTVVARFRGRGTKRILLLAHMDTVYQRGMLAQQPFRIDGDRAFGLGIADDKHGVALILHTLALLKASSFDGYGLVTVLISPDEEVGSIAERDLITTLGGEHDIVFSCEGSGQDDSVRLATSGAQVAVLTVKGRAAHAGSAPDRGRNALYELAHQLLQMRDLSMPSKAVKVNWTVANAGSVSNAIPAEARALGDMRADDERDFAAVEATIRERIRNHLIPDTTVEVKFERMYPPMPFREQSARAAEHAKRVYAEIGGTLKVNTVSTGGGTDAAYAALKTAAPVIEGLGLQNFGSHSNDAEYINISSIEPRLYLLTRMVMDASAGKIAGMR